MYVALQICRGRMEFCICCATSHAQLTLRNLSTPSETRQEVFCVLQQSFSASEIQRSRGPLLRANDDTCCAKAHHPSSRNGSKRPVLRWLSHVHANEAFAGAEQQQGATITQIP